MAWLALAWKLFGFGPLVTRCAMLLLAAFSLLGLVRLAKAVANTQVAVVTTTLTAVYPVFFAQSSLAQVDLPAAGLIFWGLEFYVRKRRAGAVIWFSLAALAKETAIIVPLALLIWEVSGSRLLRARIQAAPKERAHRWPLLIPVLPLALWYAYHYARTGFIFGNPEFFRYNVQGTLHPLRIVLALLMRIWQTVGYLDLYLLTLAGILAMPLPPIKDAGGARPRIAAPVQLSFLVIAICYVIALSIIGGAVLARYMLPVVPLVILAFVSTVWRRLPAWKAVVVLVALAFVGALFVNPPYGFSPEDNLAYRDYIRLHQHAEAFLAPHYPKARVLTAWPASDELSRPYLGYVQKPIPVVRIEDFTAEQLLSAADARSRFDVALVFSTKYEPPRPILARWKRWQEWKSKYFGYHRDLTPEAAASVLGGNLVYVERRHGQWVGVIEVERIEEAMRAPFTTNP